MKLPTWRGRNGYRARAIAKMLLVGVIWKLAFVGMILEGQISDVEREARAKALLNLRSFVKWPAASDAPVTIGILGDDSFGSAFEGRNITIKRSKQIEDLKDCQIIFIANSERAKVEAIIDKLAGANVLTVGESEGFAKQGGVIGMVIDGETVRFEINTAAARRAGLGIDLRLLKLALRVINS